MQDEQQPKRDPGGHSASDEPAESDPTAAPDVAASEADAAAAPAAAEPQPAAHAGKRAFLVSRVSLPGVDRAPVFLTFVLAELRDAADESADFQTAGHPAVAVLSARPAADAEENVGSATARSELGQ